MQKQKHVCTCLLFTLQSIIYKFNMGNYYINIIVSKLIIQYILGILNIQDIYFFKLVQYWYLHVHLSLIHIQMCIRDRGMAVAKVGTALLSLMRRKKKSFRIFWSTVLLCWQFCVPTRSSRLWIDPHLQDFQICSMLFVHSPCARACCVWSKISIVFLLQFQYMLCISKSSSNIHIFLSQTLF